MPRQGNQERATWRARSRAALSEHIKSKLGLEIQPEEVRLLTGPPDAYRWKWLPQRDHLFQKHLSKHNVTAYREICEELGKSFEVGPLDDTAMQPQYCGDASVAEDQRRKDMAASTEPSFTSRIRQLEEENRRLQSQVEAQALAMIEHDRLVLSLQTKSAHRQSRIRRLRAECKRLEQEKQLVLNSLENRDLRVRNLNTSIHHFQAQLTALEAEIDEVLAGDEAKQE